MAEEALVQCTELEEEVFSTLLAVVKEFELSCTLRVAGGWVRDKLLGRHSTDIDIALDNMLGREFAEYVNQYLKARGKEVRRAAYFTPLSFSTRPGNVKPSL